MKKHLIIGLTLLAALVAKGQYTQQDTLRGSITPERKWWDLKYYHLDVKVNPADSTIGGDVTIGYVVLESYQTLQVDLQAPLQITSVKDEKGKSLEVRHDGNAHFVKLTKKQKPGQYNQIVVSYSGHPKIAIRPPWDGGFSWQYDEEGNWFIHTNCQGIGASIWWPNKDHMYDEVDSMLISVNVPGNLMDVSNGQLRGVEELSDGTKTYHWYVNNPINNYGVDINIANYLHFGEVYQGAKGPLKMDYYVLPYNLEKAKSQFKDAPRMMEAFEYWFGPYPFYEDGYKLVEVPSTGMEHQSSVTYGNKYANGYRGRDDSGTGYGLKFDFIIIHESGHEWFANNITYQDMADMWIHESFTNYSESLFVEYYWGKEAGQSYVRGIRRGIGNKETIIGDYEVNDKGSGDMYPKGGNMLNTLRTIVDNDELWRSILRGLNETFYHQTVTTAQIEGYMSEKTGIELKPFFGQYLRDVRIPTLEYYHKDGQLSYRWTNCVAGFDMKIPVLVNGEKQWIKPITTWTSTPVAALKSFEIDPNIYAATFRVATF